METNQWTEALDGHWTLKKTHDYTYCAVVMSALLTLGLSWDPGQSGYCLGNYGVRNSIVFQSGKGLELRDCHENIAVCISMHFCLSNAHV